MGTKDVVIHYAHYNAGNTRLTHIANRKITRIFKNYVKSIMKFKVGENEENCAIIHYLTITRVTCTSIYFTL